MNSTVPGAPMNTLNGLVLSLPQRVILLNTIEQQAASKQASRAVNRAGSGYTDWGQ